ncbi:MAG: hypothetical protein ACI9G1_005821 [Pirellulaceae bacterium]|jgi:hypothetical protein
MRRVVIICWQFAEASYSNWNHVPLVALEDLSGWKIFANSTCMFITCVIACVLLRW